jgi:NAD(P)-dependent dehydrogenase (short-subunit alcohol dehydrogenase family)
MKLEDKVALITGAGSGLGRASAILFASEGASIGVADINLDSAEETANEIRRAGGRALALQVDVSNGSRLSPWSKRRSALIGEHRGESGLGFRSILRDVRKLTD